MSGATGVQRGTAADHAPTTNAEDLRSRLGSGDGAIGSS
jgi:hypothetical protein